MNKSKVLLALTASALLGATRGNSQIDPQYRQNITNALMLNPAQAGANQHNEINVVGSAAWIGFEGAPRTFALSGNINMDNAFGIGVTAHADQAGPVRNLNLGFNLAKHVRLSNRWNLSIGLNANISSLDVALNTLGTTVNNDPLMNHHLSSGLRFNLGWGALAYSDHFYIGISQPRVLDVQFSNVNMADYIQSNGIIGYIGHNHKLFTNQKIKSFIMYRYIPGSPMYLDAGTTVSLNNVLDLGLIYQFNSAAGIFAGINITDDFYFGYTYSIPTTEIRTVTIQSHEVLLRYKLKSKHSKKSGNSARFFN